MSKSYSDKQDVSPAKGILIILAVILTVFLLSYVSGLLDDKPAPSAVITTQNTSQQRLVSERRMDDVKSYERFLTQDEQYYKASSPNSADLERINKSLTLFSSLAETIHNAQQDKAELSPTDTEFVKKTEQRLSSLQQRILPGLRLAFKKQAASQLWESDITVTVSGGNNTTILLVGSLFASNANIKRVSEELEDVLMKLRFKRLHFQWYAGSEGWSRKLDTPADGKISAFKFKKFME